MTIESIDTTSIAIYLEIPPSQVVLLQGFFECYETLGTVRTFDVERSLVCVITSEALRDDCLGALEGLRPIIHWRFADPLISYSRWCKND